MSDLFPTARMADFEALATRRAGFASVERLRHRCRETFKGIDLAGKALLEIGAGLGVFSAYAAIAGARRVVALEPEAAGSTKGYASGIQELTSALGLTNLHVVGQTIQEYDGGEDTFDLVLLYNSINHLDEPMCTEIRRSEEARQVYRRLFRKIASLTAPGGLLLIADVSRHNFWPKVGLRNPLARSIEWHKHQSPGIWGDLLRPLGFDRQSVTWYRFYPLRRLGPLAGNAVAAFFLSSHFRLVLKKRPGDPVSRV